MNILLIEDNPAQIKLVHLLLGTEGNSVSESHNAEQALKSIGRERPELIIVDLALPDMDGLTLVRTLKTDPSLQHIPIVAVTGFPDLWNKEQALAAGCDAYLVKPIDTRALARQVADVTTR